MIAFLIFADCPEDQKPAGIPEVWPWQIEKIEEEQRKKYEAAGWMIAVDQEAFDAYLGQHQAEFDAWTGIDYVPKILSARQIRLAMLEAGIGIDKVAAMLSELDEPLRSIATISWEYSSEFHRDNELLVSLAPKLGLESDAIDKLFYIGANI